METDWHSFIKIIQVPDMKNKNQAETSWLCDPFGDERVYGSKFTLEEDYFSWKFFLKEESKKEALINGYRFLDYLRGIYPGLSGEVKAKPIDHKKLNKKKNFFELRLPKPFFSKKINLFHKIINLFIFNKKHRFEIYILWHKDDSIIGELEETELEKEYKLDNNFQIKVYISVVPKFDKNTGMEEQKAELLGHLEYLTTEIQNVKGEKASLRQVSSDILEYIFEGTAISKNIFGKSTGRFLSGIADQIPEDEFPGFVSPRVIDFTIPEYFLLEKALKVRNENINFLKKPNQNDIYLGNYISRGVITDKKVTLAADDLIHHVLISGLTGSGKTTFTIQAEHEISLKMPNCGILIIGLRKKEEYIPYKLDLILKYKDPQLRIPYFFKGENVEVTFEQIAALLASSLGLKQPVDIVMYNVLIDYFNENREVPDSLEQLFGKVLVWFEKYTKYNKKYRQSIRDAIKNRALQYTKSPTLDKITRLPSIKPFWFIEWMNGKNVYIDLSEEICNTFIKKLLVNLIFQMIRTFFPQSRANKLKNVIILDEVGEIGKKPKTTSPYDDEFITQYFFEKVFSDFLEAFRSRGIAIIMTAQKPSDLFESIYSLPNIIILFTTAHSCSKLFTNDIEEQDMLAKLGKRRAIIIDGVNGRKFAFYTKDFEYDNYNQIISKTKSICSSCENYTNPYDNFCSACGIPLNLEKSTYTKKKNEESITIQENNE